MIFRQKGYNKIFKGQLAEAAVAPAGKRRIWLLSAALVLPLAVCVLLRLQVRPPEPEPPAEALRPQSVTVVSAAQQEETAPLLTGPRARRPGCYNILLLGTDAVGGGSDTMLLARFDTSGRRIDLVSLPRDTLLHHEWYSNRLNYAYASGGVELLRAEVENLLGVPVDYFVNVNLAGFVSLVDRIGGVEFDVPADMDYDDPAQGLHIHYTKGPHRLSGQQALEVVRWRRNNDGSGYADADLGRIATQQAFLRACAQTVRPAAVPALAQAAFTSVRTDLTAGNLAWLALEALDIGTDGLHFHTLPGDGAGCYRRESVYVLDPGATLALVNEALDPYNEPIGAEEMDILVP